MKLNHSQFLSIAITPTVVKVALVKGSGLVEKLALRSVDPNNPSAALLNALQGIPTKGVGVLCVIPGDIATTKTLEVPSVDSAEIESILALQASRHTPFNKDEILTSYIKLGNPRPNFTKVLLVVVKREIVQDRIALLKRVGLDVAAVQFVPEGIARFYAGAFKLKKTDLPVAIIDVGMQSTNFIVTSHLAVVMSRSIPTGAEHIVGDPEAAQQLINEIKASMDAYEQDAVDRKPARFVLTTNHPALSGLDVGIGGAIGIKVETIPYTKFVQVAKGVKEIMARDFADDSAIDVIATGVTAAKSQVDLVPQEIKDQRSIADKGQETFKAGVLIIFLLLFFGGALMSKVYYKDTFLKQNLVEKYADQRQEVKDLEKLIAKTKILREYALSRDVSLESVRELYNLIPQEIYLNNINMDEASNLSIQGVADSMSNVFSFVSALEGSPIFEGVKTKSTATKKDKDKNVATFEIVMQLTKPDANAKALSAKDVGSVNLQPVPAK